MNTKTLLLTLGGTVGAVALPLSVVSCTKVQNNDNKNETPELEKPGNGGINVPDSDKVPAKERVKIVIPFTTDWYGENRITTYKLGSEAEILKLNSHIKGINFKNWITLTKGRLLENAINGNLVYDEYSVDNFFKGIAIYKDKFENILKLYDKETAFKLVETK